MPVFQILWLKFMMNYFYSEKSGRVQIIVREALGITEKVRGEN